jgi:hypothetical protein
MASLPPIGTASVALPQAPPVGRKDQEGDGDQDDLTRAPDPAARSSGKPPPGQATGSTTGVTLDITA